MPDSFLAILTATTLISGWVWIIVLAIFGAIIGSFLNVVIYRFHTGRSLSGRSHCMSCGRGLVWYELFPVASYVVLRGRCRTCSSYVPSRYALVEGLTAGLFVLAGLTADSAVELLWLVALLSVLVVLSVYDYYHLIIPDRLTVYVSVLIGGWWVYLVYVGERTAVDALTALALAFAAAIFFFLLWLGTRGRALGFGDVKLALPLGLLATAGTASVAGATSAGVGAGSMAAAAFSFVALSFWVGAIISLSYLAISALRAHKRGQPHLPGQPRLTMKSAVPFGPFMVIGALLVYVFHVNVLQLFSFM